MAVAHQAVRQQLRVKPRQPMRHHSQKLRSVGVVDEDVFLAITPGRHVIRGSGELDAKGA
jgi:hypothetical protein